MEICFHIRGIVLSLVTRLTHNSFSSITIMPLCHCKYGALNVRSTVAFAMEVIEVWRNAKDL